MARLLHNNLVCKAFRPDLENPTRADAELASPAMPAMPIPLPTADRRRASGRLPGR
ncbi:MAG TPA: hypothetical protein VLH10_19315 [Yinghuangia sp.]|nr:hypothetical protein [Yinghuangia sp.]